jgi:hypothetical protein
MGTTGTTEGVSSAGRSSVIGELVSAVTFCVLGVVAVIDFVAAVDFFVDFSGASGFEFPLNCAPSHENRKTSKGIIRYIVMQHSCDEILDRQNTDKSQVKKFTTTIASQFKNSVMAVAE